MAGLMLDVRLQSANVSFMSRVRSVTHAMYVFSLHFFTTVYVSRTNNAPLSSRWLRSMLYRFVCNFALGIYKNLVLFSVCFAAVQLNA
jgi:hypothetical protein